MQGRALRTAASLDEGLSQVVSLHPSASLEDQNNNQLVHLSAHLRTSQVQQHQHQPLSSDQSCSSTFC